MRIHPLSLSMLLAALLGASMAQASDAERGRRYLNEVFTDHIRTADLVFAENLNDATGKAEKLTMRVFEPKDDKASKRALFVLTPGGGFVRHEDDWMDDFGEQLARAGYVVAVHRYRLSQPIDSPAGYQQALFKAFSDQKAAIRYFIKDAAGANRFRIDPDNIFIGGHSAGGITSMTVGYLDAEDALPEVARNALRANGGMEGNSGNEALPYKLRGVINLSGMLTDPAIIDRGEPPLLSLHGDLDQAVPLGRDGERHGSAPIHTHADTVGLENQLYVIHGAEHNDTADSQLCPECIPLIKRFMFNQLAPRTPPPGKQGAPQ